MQVKAVISTYSKSADLTTEPPITTFDDNILRSLYERERLGWQAHCSNTGHLSWTLVPEMMREYTECMLLSPYITGEPEDHVFKRMAPVVVSARAAHRPRVRPASALGGMGSPASMRRRRL